MGASWQQCWACISTGEGQGRPLHSGLIYLLSFIGFKIGGLCVLHVMSYIIITLNSFLFYTLLKRLTQDKVFVVTGALAFCLFPADTTQIFLTSSFSAQPSLMFLLLALLCYVSDKKVCSYMLILAALLCYETVFPVFLAAPLLEINAESKLKDRLTTHALILGTMLVCVFILRLIFHQVEIHELGVPSSPFLVLSQVIKNMLIGPLVVMAMFLHRSNPTLLHLNKDMLLLFFLCIIGLTVAMFRLGLDPSGQNITPHSKKSNPSWVKLAWIGLIMTVLAYPFTLTTSAWDIAGRASRVHTAAILGGCILFASICSGAFIAAARLRKIMIVDLAIFFSLLIGFGLVTQQDYKISWQYQRAFWTDLIRLCPDITDGSVIFVDPAGLKETDQVFTYSWSLPLILEHLYYFPETWQVIPRVYKLEPGWRDKIVVKGNTINFRKAVNFLWWIRDDAVVASNAILIQDKAGVLTRSTTPVNAGGQIIKFKKISASSKPAFLEQDLYKYLIKNPAEPSIHYLEER